MILSLKLSMAEIVEGKKIAASILSDLKERVFRLKQQGLQPALAVVIVGDDKPSHIYVKKKAEAAEFVGIKFFKFSYPADITTKDLLAEMKKIQTEQRLTGLIIQLPLPQSLEKDSAELISSISPLLDVDCLTDVSLGRVLMGRKLFTPPTPAAILHVLDYYQVDLTGKEVCIVGRGEIVGRPLTATLLHYPVTVTVCGKATPDLASYTKRADIIITGVGKKNLVSGEMIKEGAVVIDAGIFYDNGKVCGDIEFESVRERAGLITPVPGGVGPITVAKLLENVVRAAEMIRN